MMIKQQKSSFDQLAKEFNKTNQAALQAITETEQASAESQETETTTPTETKAEPKAAKARRAASVNEAGMANNVYNFDFLIAFVTSFGARYNPSNTWIALPSLAAILASAQNTLSMVTTKFNEFKQQLDIRHYLYVQMPFLATRIMGELKSCGADKATIAKAQSYNNKIQGKRVKKIDPLSTDKVISASQMSFAQRISNMEGLIGVCALASNYNPNEDNLKIVNLETYITEMRTANNLVAVNNASINGARTERNNKLYQPSTGLVDTAIMVKEYVKAVYGFKSPEYKQVAALKFKNRPIV